MIALRDRRVLNSYKQVIHRLQAEKVLVPPPENGDGRVSSAHRPRRHSCGMKIEHVSAPRLADSPWSSVHTQPRCGKLRQGRGAGNARGSRSRQRFSKISGFENGCSCRFNRARFDLDQERQHDSERGGAERSVALMSAPRRQRRPGARIDGARHDRFTGSCGKISERAIGFREYSGLGFPAMEVVSWTWIAH
jgi:hypothetical protein